MYEQFSSACKPRPHVLYSRPITQSVIQDDLWSSKLFWMICKVPMLKITLFHDCYWHDLILVIIQHWRDETEGELRRCSYSFWLTKVIGYNAWLYRYDQITLFLDPLRIFCLEAPLKVGAVMNTLQNMSMSDYTSTVDPPELHIVSPTPAEPCNAGIVGRTRIGVLCLSACSTLTRNII